MTADIDPAIGDAIARRPDTAWVRRGQALFGWGAAATVEPGSGADRFDRSLRRLRASGAPIAMASFTQPGLSTVQQDTRLAGEVLVDSLIGLIRGEAVESRKLPAKLVPRGSTGAG